jgi:exopolysaccharide production protein ExoZ
MRRPYYYGIDLIRFIAAISVLIFHLGYLNQSGIEYRPLWPVAWQGWVGVEIFFVISGLVIANSAAAARPIGFLRGRALRLYPAAWCCATLTFMVKGPSELVPYLHSMALLPKGPWIDDVYWTLSVEIAFYFLVFMLLCFNVLSLINRAALLMTAINALCLSILVARHFGFEGGQLAEKSNLVFGRHGCFFALGIWIWLATTRPLKIWERCAVIIAVLIGLTEINLRGSEFLPYPNLVWLISPALTWGVAVLGIAFFARRTKAPTSLTRLLRDLGLMTYPLYLIHNVVGRAFESALFPLSDKWAAFAVSAISMIALSWIVCKILEPGIRALIALGAASWSQENKPI